MKVRRWAHAYREGQTVTLCAMPLEILDWKELAHIDFTAIPERNRCELCDLLADSG